jgi:hypothetical protein
MDILHLAAPCRNVPVTFTLDRHDIDPCASSTIARCILGLPLRHQDRCH